MTEEKYWQIKEKRESILCCARTINDIEQGRANEFLSDPVIREGFLRDLKQRQQILLEEYSLEYINNAIQLFDRIREIERWLHYAKDSRSVWLEGDCSPSDFVDLKQYPEIFQIVYNLLSDKLSDLRKEFEEL